MRRFDGVVVATHADQALALLEDPSSDEQRIARRFEYTTNDTVLHTDSRSCRGRARHARRGTTGSATTAAPTLTYYLNRLQSLDADRDYCLTLNGRVPDEHVLDRGTFEHPLFTVESVAAQRELAALSGVRRTWFAGAHHGNGFHEDGLASGVRAAASIGVRW